MLGGAVEGGRRTASEGMKTHGRNLSTSCSAVCGGIARKMGQSRKRSRCVCSSSSIASTGGSSDIDDASLVERDGASW